MDPYAVLGVSPTVTDDELTHAYRTLAKRLHPDTADAPADAAAQMRRVNEAYAAARKVRERTPVRAVDARPLRAPGWWLTTSTRQALGGELVGTLEDHERVVAIAATAVGAMHDVRLAVTDRRVLWLRNDAITDRVAIIRRDEITGVRSRVGRWRRTARLDVGVRARRRPVRFGEIDPAALPEVAAAVRALLTT